MMGHVYLADAENGQQIEGFYLLREAQSRISSNGRPYLTAVVADASGEMDAKVWDYAGPVGPENVGNVIKLRGEISEYRGALQLTIGRLRLAGEKDPWEPGELVPVAPIDRQAALEEVRALLESIGDQDYRRLALTIFDRRQEEFSNIPAGKSVHHSFLGGLLMHTADMLRAADFLAGLYSHVIDRSLLLTGVFLHDLMKAEEYLFSPLGIVTEYSVKGQLLGHPVMGARLAADTARELGLPEEKSVLLQHMILSHHGQPEFGAAVRPMCAEAELLSAIDAMDSRMEIYADNLAAVKPGEFTQRIYVLEKRIYRHG